MGIFKMANSHPTYAMGGKYLLNRQLFYSNYDQKNKKNKNERQKLLIKYTKINKNCYVS